MVRNDTGRCGTAPTARDELADEDDTVRDGRAERLAWCGSAGSGGMKEPAWADDWGVDPDEEAGGSELALLR